MVAVSKPSAKRKRAVVPPSPTVIEVMRADPNGRRRLVLDVLHAMGYGGSRDDTAQRLGQSGDEGIDGVIREDRLGLDLIYVQAKRWTSVVGRPKIQKFFGALHGKRATKGVFITTSTFSRDAVDYAEGVTPRVILVDGKELAQLMIEHGVGVTASRQYEISRIDLDYFTSDDSEASTPPAPLGDDAALVNPEGQAQLSGDQ